MDPTQRFSGRAGYYLKYRPRYPRAVLETIERDCGLTADARVADIGSGTGALTELFLANGNTVYAVEPNPEMRRTAERVLAAYPGFKSVAGRAEATTLQDRSVDYAVVGAAFHWFDLARARLEFLRILRPPRWTMVAWNEREFESTPFLAAYDRLLREFAPDYARERHKSTYDTAMAGFFGAAGFREKTFSHRQEFDCAGLKGRMLSSSYTPEPGHPNHEPLMAGLEKIFQTHQVRGRVTFDYTTRMYYGRL